jgi:hypothetical protein
MYFEYGVAYERRRSCIIFSVWCELLSAARFVYDILVMYILVKEFKVISSTKLKCFCNNNNNNGLKIVCLKSVLYDLMVYSSFFKVSFLHIFLLISELLYT